MAIDTKFISDFQQNKFGPALQAAYGARYNALQTHTNFAGALKLNKTARELAEYGRNYLNTAINNFDPTDDPSWITWLAKFRDGDQEALTTLGNDKAALLADLIANAKITPRKPLGGSTLGNAALSNPTAVGFSEGGKTYDGNGEPVGDGSETPWGWIAGGVAAVLLIVAKAASRAAR